MSLVLTEDRCAVRHLVINRPEKRNALNGDTIRELGAAIEAAAADDSVRVVILRGEGPMFSSGMDLNDLRELSESPENKAGTAALVAIPAVRHAASAWRRYSTGVGPWSDPTSTGG